MAFFISYIYKKEEWGFSSVFFQAEDGIRDVERSRGLGDVYKRQLQRGMYLQLREELSDHQCDKGERAFQ